MAFPYISDIIKHVFGISIPLPLPTFGFFVAIAFLVAYWVFAKDVRRLEADGVLPTAKGKKLSTMISDFAFTTAISGMLGARLFHILEYPSDFMADPMGMIFSRGGLTILGGLITGAMGGVWFIKKRGIPVWPTADAAVPVLALGYAIGRIGCQLAGDGDWGTPANMALKPSWLPEWFWAQQYIGNVNEQVIPPPGVYPTPFYETVACLMIFGILWACRKHRHAPGWLVSLYLLLSGIERILIEQIRVNSRYQFFNISFTQAEFLSTFCIVGGVVGLLYFWNKESNKTA